MPVRYAEQFIIFSLPRSRSAWMAHFLRYAGRQVLHDHLIECRSIADFTRAFDMGINGCCETSAMLGWQVLRDRMPGVKKIIIRRDINEVANSLLQAGFPVDFEELEIRAAMLDALAHQPEVHHYSYDQLSHPEHGPHVLREIFEYALGIPMDWEWGQRMDGINVQVKASDRIAKLRWNARQIERLKSEVRVETQRLDGSQLCLFN